MKPKVFSIKSKEDRVREEAQCGSLNLMNSESSLKDQTKGLTLDGVGVEWRQQRSVGERPSLAYEREGCENNWGLAERAQALERACKR
ncbi:hypothetical protein U1Q18_031777 [Sarracenia purpurea var. burkii]